MRVEDAGEVLEICNALLDLEVPGKAIAPILRYVADRIEERAKGVEEAVTARILRADSHEGAPDPAESVKG